MVVTVVKIESRSFSSAEIQHFKTENTRSDYNWRILDYLNGINYYKLAVEKDRDSIFTTISHWRVTTITTIWKPGYTEDVRKASFASVISRSPKADVLFK
jgi:hypothetical protein